MNAPTSAAAVANAFLDIQDGDATNYPRIDQMKLQKLLFYAHAWWLALQDGPLFDEEIYAWPWGPVVPSIYGEFKDFGSRPITGRRATELVKTGNGPVDFEIRTPPAPSENVADFLRKVWDTHKQYSGVRLSNATHAEGEPWTIVKNKYATLDGKPQIPNDLIKQVFKKKLPAA